MRLILCCLLIPSLVFAGTDESSWPQWRGPSRDGHIAGKPWPASANLKELQQSWQVDLSPSYSGPIIADGMIFITETRNRSHEVVRALNLESGEQLWKTEWRGAMSVPFFARRNGSWIRSTPIYNEGKLYVAGMEDLLVCLDARSGKILWKLDFPKELGTKKPTFGYVSSPLIDGDYLFTQAGGALIKLNKNSGQLIWRSMKDGGGMMGSAFSSPIMTSFNDVKTLVVQSREVLAGIAPEGGEILWQKPIPSYRGMNILTPTIYKEGIFTSNYRGQSYFFKVNNTAKKSNLELQWEHKAKGYMSTPVIVGNHAYMHLQNRRLSCINLETGEETWRSSDIFGDYWSMAVVGENILALDSNGELILLKPNPEKLQILSRRNVANSSSWAHIAVAGNQVAIRELDALTLWQLPTTTSSAAISSED